MNLPPVTRGAATVTRRSTHDRRRCGATLTNTFAAHLDAIRDQLDAGIKKANVDALREAAAGIVKMADELEAAQVPDLDALKQRAELDAVKS